MAKRTEDGTTRLQDTKVMTGPIITRVGPELEFRMLDLDAAASGYGFEVFVAAAA